MRASLAVAALSALLLAGCSGSEQSGSPVVEYIATLESLLDPYLE